MEQPEDCTLSHGSVVSILGETVMTPSLPDWDISYIKRQNLNEQRRVILKARLNIVKVTAERIYFEES